MYPLKCKDKRERFIVHGTRIVWMDAGTGKIEFPHALLSSDEQCCNLIPGHGVGPGIIIDFGQELNGGVCLDIDMTSPATVAKIRLRFGESVSEVMGQPDKDHAFHDFILDISCMSKQEIGNTGFRFIRLDLLDTKNSITIRQIKAVAVERLWSYKGNFDCSDPLLNQIWLTGARTVHLCCQDYIYDGIKRDRLVWVGDIHPQISVIAQVFGNEDIVPQSLDLIRNRTVSGHWMNDISSYSLWWILCVWDWYWYTGDKEFLRSQAAYLEELSNRLISHIDSSGREKLGGYFMDCIDPSEQEKLDGVRFLDWASAGDKIVIAEGLQALFIWAMNKAVIIFEELSDFKMQDKCRAAAKCLCSVPIIPIQSKQVNALRVLAGIADPQETNHACFVKSPGEGLSTWFALYVLQARAVAGDYFGCLDLIRSYWGGMLNLGATTFWEHFNLAWLENACRIDEIVPPDKLDVHADCGEHCYKGLRHSLCHGWGGGPTAWLSQNVLGIQPVAPGFSRISIKPNLGNLTFAKGSVPTPFGLITVAHERSADGTIITEYDIPRGVKVESPALEQTQKYNKSAIRPARKIVCS